MGSSERISGCCDLLIANAKAGVKIFGVVSAMGVAKKGEPKVTDCLINATDMASARDPAYAEELVKLEHKHRTTAEALLTDKSEFDAYMSAFDAELTDLASMLKAMSIAGTSTQAFADFVVGHGELWTARLCAAAIRCKGYDAEWIDARDVLIVTDAEDGGVDVDYERSNANLDKIFNDRGHGEKGAGRILIATGFIARTPDGVPTTLKRNGSDYSATIFGAMLIAAKITIWTDVDGVYSADPRKVKEAVCLDTLSYNEAWELSYFGANVLHPRKGVGVMASIPARCLADAQLQENFALHADELGNVVGVDYATMGGDCAPNGEREITPLGANPVFRTTAAVRHHKTAPRLDPRAGTDVRGHGGPGARDHIIRRERLPPRQTTASTRATFPIVSFAGRRVIVFPPFLSLRPFASQARRRSATRMATSRRSRRRRLSWRSTGCTCSPRCSC